MKKLHYLFVAFLFPCAEVANAQDTCYEKFITTNINLYIPRSANMGMFPVIGFDRRKSPKVLVGGFGAGFVLQKTIAKKTLLNWQGNFSRIAYWERRVDVRSTNNEPLGIYPVSAVDYSLGLAGMAHYSLSRHFSAGAGFGVQALVLSVSQIRADVFDNPYLGRNRSFFPAMPTVPLELQLHLENTLVTLRYEHALLNRYRGDVAKQRDDRYSLLFLEIGFRL